MIKYITVYYSIYYDIPVLIFLYINNRNDFSFTKPIRFVFHNQILSYQIVN